MVEYRKVPLKDNILSKILLLRAVFYAFVDVALGRGIQSKPRAKRFLYAIIRYLLDHATIPIDYALGYPGTEGRFVNFAKKEGFPSDVVDLGNDAKALWMGSKDAERIIVWFHGGGFALAMTQGHLNWWRRWQKSLNKEKSTSVVFLRYTLVPQAAYPTQIRQAVSLMNYLLVKCNKRPEQLIIGGDSAGGNITLAILSHILHPHPKVAEKIKLKAPLGGALLVSPWVNFTKSDPIFEANVGKDIIGHHVGDRWGPNYRLEAMDNYIEAVYAEPEWYHGLEKVVRKIFVWGGGAEVLLGSITTMAKNLRAVHSDVEYFVEDDAIHTAFFIDGDRLPPVDTVSTRKIEKWLAGF